MASKNPLSPHEKSAQSGFWAGFAGKRAAEAELTQTQAEEPTQGVSQTEPRKGVELQPSEWARVRGSLKKALSAPSQKKAASCARAWSAATRGEAELEWADAAEKRLKPREPKGKGSATAAGGKDKRPEWARAVPRAPRPGARQSAPSLWSLVRALFKKSSGEPPTGR